MGNLIEAASNVFNQNNQTETDAIATDPKQKLNNIEDQFDEFIVTEEHILNNPLLELPSEILQLIVTEIDPDLTELARYFFSVAIILLEFWFIFFQIKLLKLKSKLDKGTNSSLI